MKINTLEKEDIVFRTLLKEKIKAYNNEISALHLASREPSYMQYIQIEITDQSQFVAGLTGRIYWSCLEIDDLFIEKPYRYQGFGTTLIENVIQYATEKKLKFIILNTFSFQAKPFYEKLGFYTIGEIKNYPDKHSLYTLRYDIQ